ncbi:putative porin [Rhodohalobacter halophilus]|uniref:putative porin n=1 Tax=Rhodohalobacter halophilus TaxID=1812810 RepID=UPI00083F7920|nr:putative porin [Rhodohalobacter halophilus]
MIYLLTIWTALTFSVQDTIPPVQQDSLREAAINDTIPAAEADTTSFEEPEPEVETPDTVYVWTYQQSPGLDIAETDSTLRWVNQVNFFDRFYGERGAITYRLGTSGRLDGVELHSYETRHMNVEMEGVSLNDPLTGAVNWNRIPIRKIKYYEEADYGATYRSRIRLQDHYLTQPRTYLNFDESKYDYRNLDFVFTQNFRADTNLEFSFWDRRDGGGYNRSGVEGRQASAKVYHQLNDQWMAKLLYLNNALDRQESFGYNVDNPLLFPFNIFTATPRENSASSNQTSSDIFLKAQYRPNVDRDVRTELGLHYQTDNWSLEYSADSLATSFSRAELFAKQNFRMGRTALTVQGSGTWLRESEEENLTENSWFGGAGVAEIESRIIPWVKLQGYALAEGWSDGRFSSEISGKVTLFPDNRITLAGFGGVLDRAPDIQSVYWQSNLYSGNPDLLNEQEMTAGASLEVKLTDWLLTGVRGDIRFNENSIFLGNSDQFVNIDSYTHLSATGWIGLDSRIFEGEISALYKSSESDSQNEINLAMAESGERVWLKGKLYWKNYLFDRATYVKAGVSGVFSPNPFRTAEYIAPLNRWQHGTNSTVNPSYHRMDVDVSARIRWFMLLLKWENVLDGVNQLGYFESVGYPMPERRFRLGLRILFTN